MKPLAILALLALSACGTGILPQADRICNLSRASQESLARAASIGGMVVTVDDLTAACEIAGA